MDQPAALVRAVIKAVVAQTSDRAREDLTSAMEPVRIAAEDALVDRIENELGALAMKTDKSAADAG